MNTIKIRLGRVNTDLNVPEARVDINYAGQEYFSYVRIAESEIDTADKRLQVENSLIERFKKEKGIQ